MKFTFVIPVYIARSSKEGWKVGDAVYDHPTALDDKGTLVRTLESLQSIEHEDFQVILVIAAVHSDLEKKSMEWLDRMLMDAHCIPKNVYAFSYSHLKNISQALVKKDDDQFSSLLGLNGYSEVRNAGFIAATLLHSDIVIWLDDDELVRDINFLNKLKEGFSKKIKGQQIRLITGACPEGETGSYLRVREMKPWMTYWNKIKYQNEAFSKIIGTTPRWKISPFAHGGLSAIHKDVFAKIPCDPTIRRGEDMDFNMNARMFGYAFFLDNTLEIRHCPPPRVHPQWMRVREDAVRYLRQRNKLQNQRHRNGMRQVMASDFDPYPGQFLKDNLDEMIFRSQIMLASEYLVGGKIEDAQEALKTIEICLDLSQDKYDAFAEYIKFQKLWVRLISKIKVLRGNFLKKL